MDIVLHLSTVFWFDVFVVLVLVLFVVVHNVSHLIVGSVVLCS